MLKLFQWSTPIDFKDLLFSGGERQIRLSGHESNVFKPWTIKARLRSAEDIMRLLLVNDAIKRENPSAPVFLECPYLPYARQDRACHPGEAFSLSVMASLLRTADFARITVWDVHSAVAEELLPGLNVRSAAEFLKGQLKAGEIVVAPDKGAVSRATDAADGHRVIMTDKVRNPDDGRISGFRLVSDMTDVDPSSGAIVVDDICDGGCTFIGVADVLRDAIAGPLRLYVTHGIFSAGFGPLLEAYDEILVANLMTDDPLPDRVRVIAQP